MLIMCLGFLFAYAQNEKNLVVDANAEARTVNSFTAIEVSDAIDLYISQGNTEAVAISGSTDDIKTQDQNRSAQRHPPYFLRCQGPELA
jgi:hypothetical protein